MIAAPRNILFVDDEVQLLEGLKKVLRPYRSAWKVDTALGGVEAYAALEEGRWDAVVSDARMPDIDGEKVLQRARERQPQAVRLVLSGQVDAKTGHRLASVAHQFLAKPSPGGAIIAAVEDSCRVRDSLEDPKLREVVAAMGALPMSPRTYHRISGIVDSPVASLDEVAAVVADNVALSATLLRLVSSAFFGVPRKVSSVREAVALLGLQAVREAVLLTEVFAEPDTLGLMNEVQRRALFRARMARLIAEGSPMTALASEAALLADLGVYVLALRLPVTYRGIWERHRSQKVPLREVELEVLGVSHDRLGAALLGMWNLPATVVTAVGCAHELPSGDAIIDTRSVLALSNLMVDEVLGLSVVAEDPAVDRLSAQLGLSARLPMLRDWAAKTWTSLVSKEDL